MPVRVWTHVNTQILVLIDLRSVRVSDILLNACLSYLLILMEWTCIHICSMFGSCLIFSGFSLVHVCCFDGLNSFSRFVLLSSSDSLNLLEFDG